MMTKEEEERYFQNHPSSGLKVKWETITNTTNRLKVPGGWVYTECNYGLCFVPESKDTLAEIRPSIAAKPKEDALRYGLNLIKILKEQLGHTSDTALPGEVDTFEHLAKQALEDAK